MTDTATRTHFTAWLVNDPSCLDQGRCDLTVLQDWLAGADPDKDGDWSTDSSRPTAFYAVTTVDAKDGDIDQAKLEAEALLDQAGWTLAGDWDAVPNAYTVTVEGGPQAVWSVVCGISPGADAVEPGAASVSVPTEVEDWATGHGLHLDDPDVYLLVTTTGRAGEVIGEIAWMQHPISPTDLAALEQALAERDEQDQH